MKKFLKQIVAIVLSCFMLFSVACTTKNGSSSSSSLSSTNSSSSSQSSSEQSSSSISSAISSSSASSSSSSQGGSGEMEDINNYIINDSSIPLMLHYDCEAPILSTENSPIGTSSGTIVADDSWEEWSLPIGNGYFGANVFGRTETERVQISEKTITNPNEYINGNSVGGLNNFSETYIDFNHDSNSSTNYKRYLDLKTAISGVEYYYNGVKYTREYFTSYPDKVLVIKLNASTANTLSFTLRPTIPYEQDYMTTPGDNISKHGTVTSKVENGVGQIELSGKMGFYDIDFLGLYKVYTNGGTMSAQTTQHTYTDTAGVSHTDTDGTIVVENATSAYILVTLGTDYELSSEVFTAEAELNNCLNDAGMPTFDPTRPTFKTDLDDTRLKVEADMAKVENLIKGMSYIDGYETLKNRHIEDYSEMFSRTSLNLNCEESDFELTTDVLIDRYRQGIKSNYVELLLFQYGRYMLIASSREGSLPNHLQGVWNTYNSAPWSCNYTHNINVQMNYWAAFSTNLAETFESYFDYNQAYMEAAQAWADLAIVWNGFNDLYDKDGGNGWVVGHSANPYRVTYDASSGNLGFTTQLFWEYYLYTQDKEKLQEVIYPALASAAKFITKMVIKDENGNYLIAKCDSPEQYVNGQWYYTTGTTYAQSFSYLNNYNLLLAAKELGIDLTDESVLSREENTILKTVLEQIDKYDPIIVGLSGQIKEFREEEYYGDLGEWQHRHISQLVGLFPGNLINGSTLAWLDAAKVTLTERGYEGVGWSAAHKICLWARTKDGDTAHSILGNLIGGGCIAPNLWDLYFRGTKDTFQIEGNFGATAGIAEFLLQSDAGYIEPLAALPNAWFTGSYTGLVARGNFEISADWQNGLAKSINVLSRSGGIASVYYPSITNAIVRTINGDIVNYTIDGENLISFETQVGETYVIYGFTSQDKLSAPQNLTYTRQGLGEFNLSWNTVENAESYNVYVAIESQADYTLVGKVQGTTFTYLPSQENLNARLTFVVTATAENYTESNRTLCYYDPNTFSKNNILQGKEFVGAKGTEYDTSNDLDFSYAKLTDGDFAQDYGADNWKYGRYSSLVNGYADATIDLLGSYILTEIRFYCFSGDTARIGTNFTLQVLSNGTWVDVYKNLSNEQLKTHFVNKGSANTTKYIKLDLGAIVAQKIRFYSQALSSNTVTLYEIECSGQEVVQGSKNILLGKSFVGAPGTSTTQDEHGPYDYTKLTDGIIDIDLWYNGRFSSSFGGFADGTVDLGETYNLTEVRIYCYQGELYRAGTNFTLQVYYNGEWIDIVKDLTNEQLGNYVLKNGSTAKDTWISFDLKGIKAEKIRFYSEATATNTTVTLYEIECSGYVEK